MGVYQKQKQIISVVVKDYLSPMVIGALEYLKPINERHVKCSKIQANVTRVVFYAKVKGS